jgi:hypothetical protein
MACLLRANSLGFEACDPLLITCTAATAERESTVFNKADLMSSLVGTAQHCVQCTEHCPETTMPSWPPQPLVKRNTPVADMPLGVPLLQM